MCALMRDIVVAATDGGLIISNQSDKPAAISGTVAAVEDDELVESDTWSSTESSHQLADCLMAETDNVAHSSTSPFHSPTPKHTKSSSSSPAGPQHNNTCGHCQKPKPPGKLTSIARADLMKSPPTAAVAAATATPIVTTGQHGSLPLGAYLDDNGNCISLSPTSPSKQLTVNVSTHDSGYRTLDQTEPFPVAVSVSTSVRSAEAIVLRPNSTAVTSSSVDAGRTGTISPPSANGSWTSGNGVLSPHCWSAEQNVREKLVFTQQQLAKTKEQLHAAKIDRRKLKQDKLQLLERIQNLLLTLDNERALFERRLVDQDRAFHKLATEKDEVERQKWQLSRHAKMSTERTAQLEVKVREQHELIQHLKKDLKEAREELENMRQANSNPSIDDPELTRMERMADYVSGPVVHGGNGALPTVANHYVSVPLIAAVDSANNPWLRRRGSCEKCGGITTTDDRIAGRMEPLHQPRIPHSASAFANLNYCELSQLPMANQLSPATSGANSPEPTTRTPPRRRRSDYGVTSPSSSARRRASAAKTPAQATVASAVSPLVHEIAPLAAHDNDSVNGSSSQSGSYRRTPLQTPSPAVPVTETPASSSTPSVSHQNQQMERPSPAPEPVVEPESVVMPAQPLVQLRNSAHSAMLKQTPFRQSFQVIPEESGTLCQSPDDLSSTGLSPPVSRGDVVMRRSRTDQQLAVDANLRMQRSRSMFCGEPGTDLAGLSSPADGSHGSNTSLADRIQAQLDMLAAQQFSPAGKSESGSQPLPLSQLKKQPAKRRQFGSWSKLFFWHSGHRSGSNQATANSNVASLGQRRSLSTLTVNQTSTAVSSSKDSPICLTSQFQPPVKSESRTSSAATATTTPATTTTSVSTAPNEASRTCANVPGSRISSAELLVCATQDSIDEQMRLAQEINSRAVTDWNAAHVVTWVDLVLNMPAYRQAILEHVPNGSVLLQFSDSDIQKRLRVGNAMHKLKLRLAIEELRSPRLCSYPLAGKLDHTWVTYKWLQDLGLAQYQASFASSLVDGRMLNALTRKDMDKHLGIKKNVHKVSVQHGIQLLRELAFDKQMLERRRTACSDGRHRWGDVLVWTNGRLRQWLYNVKLHEYAERVQGTGLHGAYMVYERSFSSDTLATMLGISPSNQRLRSHLAKHLNPLIRTARSELSRAPSSLPKKPNDVVVQPPPPPSPMSFPSPVSSSAAGAQPVPTSHQHGISPLSQSSLNDRAVLQRQNPLRGSAVANATNSPNVQRRLAGPHRYSDAYFWNHAELDAEAGQTNMAAPAESDSQAAAAAAASYHRQRSQSNATVFKEAPGPNSGITKKLSFRGSFGKALGGLGRKVTRGLGGDKSAKSRSNWSDESSQRVSHSTTNNNTSSSHSGLSAAERSNSMEFIPVVSAGSKPNGKSYVDCAALV